MAGLQRLSIDTGLLRQSEFGRSIQRDDPQANGAENGLCAISGIELLIDRCEVVLHRLLRDVELAPADLSEEVGLELGGDHGLARSSEASGSDQLIDGTVLDQEA